MVGCRDRGERGVATYSWQPTQVKRETEKVNRGKIKSEKLVLQIFLN